MFSFDIEPNEYTIAKKPYETLSRFENAVRLDNMYRKLVRNILNKAAAHFRATLNYYKKLPELSLAEKQIADWDLQHRDRLRLSSREYDKIYPWGFKATSTRYGKMIAARRKKLLFNIEITERDLDAAFELFRLRFEFICCGRAWLQLNPPKVHIDSFDRREAIFEKARTMDGTERIIVRDAESLSGGVDEKRDIISLDEREIIVTSVDDAKCIRKTYGMKPRSVVRASALLGDGVASGEALRLIGKISDRGYLDAVVAHHFFVAGQRPIDNYLALQFKLDRFLMHRKELTSNYMAPDNEGSSFQVSIRGHGLDARYIVEERSFKEGADRVVKSVQHSQATRVEPLLAKFVAIADPNTARSAQAKLCDPVLWVKEADEFATALHALGQGGSFILTGAAGTGKTHMVPGFVSACLANNKTVKVIAGGGALDVIEERCNAFMEKTRNIEVPMFWVREMNYLIFCSFEQRDAYSAAKTPAEKSSILSRAEVVRPHNDEADVLIIDEATLVPYDASLFETASQIVVIGDIFQIAKAGSVFAIADASGLPTFRLRRNFRAQNCDIMTWSNIFSYDNALVVKSRGRRLSEVRYAPLAAKTNGVVHAEVGAIIRAAQQSLHQGQSVGIVSFGNRQLGALIVALKTASLDKDIKFIGLPDDVQGQEADVVYVSMGAALTKGGRLPASIDGLNDGQALMRMNVALSRALQQTIVYSALLPDDIDLRPATFGQAIIRSVLESFSRLPKQNQITSEAKYNRALA